MEASERILKLLSDNHITPYELAGKLGISKSNFSLWKNEPTSNIGGEIIIKIANHFDVSCDYLLRGKEDEAHKANREANSLLPYKALVDAYRSADKKSKAIINTTLDLPMDK